MRGPLGSWLLIILVAAACQQSGSASSRPDILIASDFPTSAYRPVLVMEEAIAFAVRQQPTVDGYRLGYWPLDDSLGADQSQLRGRENVRRMIADSRVLGMVGPYTTPVGRVEILQANPAHLAMVSPTTTGSCLTVAERECKPTAASLRPSGFNNYFRITPRDPLQGRAMARYAATKLGLRRVAAFNEFGPEGTLYIKEFASEFARYLGVVVYEQDPMDDTTIDFSAFLNEAKAHGADAVYAVANEDHHVCRAAAQMRGIIPAATFLGTDGFSLNDDCIGELGTNPPAVWATNGTVDPRLSPDPAVKKQISALENGSPHASDADPYTYAAYDCARILVQAIGIAIKANGGRTPSRAQVVAALATNMFTGVTGTYKFDQNGDAENPMMSMYTVKDGRWVNVPLG